MKYTMFFVMSLLAYLILLTGCDETKPDLALISSQIKSITVYDLEGLASEKYSKQDLENAVSAPFDPKLFYELAPSVRYKDSWVLWKGSRLAVVKLNDGSEKQLALSYYGGFFKMIGEDGFFYFEDKAKKKWEEALDNIIFNDFIPKRTEKNNREQ